MLKRREDSRLLTSPFKRLSMITIPTNSLEINQSLTCNPSFSSAPDIRSLTRKSHIAPRLIRHVPLTEQTNAVRSHCVQLYKPIYVAIRSGTRNGKLLYDKGDEFELVNTIDDIHLRVIHLRTNTERRMRRTRLHLDPETPLRFGSDSRNVIQECLLEYNQPGFYLIRRSGTELGSFVLSVLVASGEKSTKDHHYLIRIDPSNTCFYLAQMENLANLWFSSFQKLIQDETILKTIPLVKIMPFRIEFENKLWHIPRCRLKLNCLIGKGEFGEVWSGLWQNENRSIPVAIKKLNPLMNDKSAINNFLREIETMKVLRNSNIVSFYGVARDHEVNDISLVTELMENGDVKNWLRSCKDVLDEKTIISWARDICCGMLFLEENNIVHRDLACRNLLISKDRSQIKIADFGLSILMNKYDLIQRKTVQIDKIPIRWVAPEVLQDPTLFSIKSDVWSFGIVLIEIWLKGKDPYPEEVDFGAIETLVLSGYVHRKPPKCSKQFYNRLILPCLCFKPNHRPNFNSLIELLNRWSTEKAEYERLNNICTRFTI